MKSYLPQVIVLSPTYQRAQRALPKPLLRVVITPDCPAKLYGLGGEGIVALVVSPEGMPHLEQAKFRRLLEEARLRGLQLILPDDFSWRTYHALS